MNILSRKWLAAMLILTAGTLPILAADDVINIPGFGPPAADSNTPPAAVAPTLHLGDPAPKLTTGKWVQGDPVKELEKGKAYLIDFWATWCPPCVESIPRLNEISKRYKDKNLVVIGQVCWEDNEGTDDDVAPFVKKAGDQMTYHVALDDQEGSTKGRMSDNWMTASGEHLLPTSFLVDTNGLVAWIGEPMDLKDGMIDDVLAGRWDLQKAAADYAQHKKDEAQMEKNDAELDKLGDELDTALEGKQWDDATAKLAEIQTLLPSDETNRLDMVRYAVFLGKKDYTNAYRVVARISEDHKDDVHLLDKLAWGIATDPSIGTRDLDLAEKIAKQGNETAKGQDPSLLDTLARLQFMRGHKDEAISFEEQAIKAATDDQKDELQQSLDAYKKGELPKDQ